ncbi:hypothetical protein R5R35_013792 [Gryllus longicercus]|uniref:Uncharacterized protein n=1 Tax=Gryllus longicercus TaxID=2509291 RepID=A0AAN9Z8S3_9ORTH
MKRLLKMLAPGVLGCDLPRSSRCATRPRRGESSRHLTAPSEDRLQAAVKPRPCFRARNKGSCIDTERCFRIHSLTNACACGRAVSVYEDCIGKVSRSTLS